MKKYLLIAFFVISFFLVVPSINISPAHAQNVGASTSATPEGVWLSDNDVTFAGKNAARAKDLFNWVLVNYQWSTNDNTLVSFWATIRNVVFVFLIVLVMVSAFLMIISGGQSLTAMQFIRKFLVVIILITFSFAIVRIFYQIVDIIQSFFIKNPDGDIISSKDLLNISFSYADFVGYRKYGAQYNESAFISLLLTKLTAATYFVMAGVLIIRKVILWFFITVSPIFPVLLLYFPVRNTAKIWVGEFFRWLLYAPLFAIFLSGLVVLWRQNINVLPFNFSTVGTPAGVTCPSCYPTAINILLGGPGQRLAIDNNINNPDTFAQYIVALIMLWVVIFLPFLLLRIFLDYLASANVNNNAWQYIRTNANKILPSTDFFTSNKPTTPPTPPPPPTYRPTGSARQLTFPTGAARAIPVAQQAAVAASQAISTTRNVSNVAANVSTISANRAANQRTQNITTQNIRNVSQTPVYKSSQSSVATSQLVDFKIPTMRDVAKVETSRLSTSISSHQDISRVNETLQKIASPQSITNPIERQQYTTIREKLVQAQKLGEPLANSILHAASNITNITNVTHQAVSTIQQSFQKVSNVQTITNETQKQQVTTFKEKLTEQSKKGNSYATTMLNTINNMAHQTTQQTSTQIQQIVEKLARPETIKDEKEKAQITELKQSIVEQSKAGNPIATSVLAASDKVAQATEATKGIIPATNQVQTVNLEDYEEVKKTWTENYKNLEVPKSLDRAERTREEWVKDDLSKTTSAIELLSSKDPQKVEEGLGEVSALLPFLLLGGFSETEIVAYLQAKKHAAEEVLSETTQAAQEEETLLERKTQTRHAQASMHMQASLSNRSNNTDDDIDEDNPLYQATHTIPVSIQPHLKSTVSPQTAQLVNFSIPTIKDVANFETAKLTPQRAVPSQMSKMDSMLQKLANPESIADEQERQTYTVMKEQLIEAQSKGDPLAASILSTVKNIIDKQHSTIQKSIVNLPVTNQVQTVNLEDYEDVRKTWADNYKTSSVPKTTENPEGDRTKWITKDVAKTADVIRLLTSNDAEEKKKGIELVGELLPFLLLGGFSESEVISYLQAKKHAGEEVEKNLKEETDEKDTLVNAAVKNSEPEKNHMQESIPEAKNTE